MARSGTRQCFLPTLRATMAKSGREKYRDNTTAEERSTKLESGTSDFTATMYEQPTPGSESPVWPGLARRRLQKASSLTSVDRPT
ncbi:hypothetical protein PGT21_029970 [Puccinia graminis f. sp. tritici]|uniref:Uncharacterized protein n=2 Tax=Puccinia graminis f. sp. tritici TaxID=56615 RepID=H6QS09_PUCGT|nr:uncharacterized protein PGTG_21576 [Puccinia graminis f. sp. tritici CRL 75-36-700-3]EHS63444.1 hypothetical protein PGTG_21576 [Puccinia graminis f. sp. tritici CRL 75-36-700-3]KAA1066405.1 hypothetical protein PGT21_029970 [Puccinia graminis f. sp. tritici]KAA1081989.1 hypothetical protein PGTUg99_031739 [Puccinia graminis f. sp. tritici]KAA1138375.1 hypothetical protein PGTUg99_033343 [Puccinia graminis f. sp. tritici]